MLKTAVLLVLGVCALVAAQECNDPQPPRGATYFWQDGDCSVEKPYCTYRGPNPEQQTCTKCRVGGGNGGLGSCDCDPRTHYCKQGGNNAGTCQPYTKLGKECRSNQDCRTTINVITSLYPTLQTEESIDEILSCVSGVCRPCNPDTWRDLVGPTESATITCGGYNAGVSDELDRYMAETAMPGFEYTCTFTGHIQVVNEVVDYNAGYPGGDRSQWTPSVDASTTTTTTGTQGNIEDATSAACWALAPTLVVAALAALATTLLS